MMKNYLRILCLSAIPFAILWLSHRICFDLFVNPFVEIGSWLFSALASEIIIITAAIRMEQNGKKKILLILLMPTLYVLPILLLIIIAVLNADWDNFGSTFV